MKCLIIEDDKNKSSEIKSWLEKNYTHVEIIIKHSYSSGLKEALSSKYKFILLDMSMPTFDITTTEKGGRPRHFAGKEIIQQMNRRNILTPVIIITQFENFGEGSEKISFEHLHKKLEDLNTDVFFGMAFYSVIEKKWQQEIKKILNKII